ncbi:aldolase [Calocera viscosa TUFC12733]|uniref:Aldolase n=1 Tax=Calocera viscosa (strain TUFC12733) TaxID=1330018 RepID=A0A167HFD0_CALVF|nr:aldolase [Calocera viscosa TUFC12733]
MAHTAHLAYHQAMYAPPLVPSPSFSRPPAGPENTYAPRYGDFLRDAGQFVLVDSTLQGARLTPVAEGERFPGCFSTEEKIRIASLLAELGVEWIEHPSPAASGESERDLRALCALGLRAGVRAQVGDMEDARLVVACGVRGVNVILSTSGESSGQEELQARLVTAQDVVRYAKAQGVEVCLAAGDVRTPLVELLKVCRAAEEAGADRVSLSDSGGCANPLQVYELVRTVRAAVGCGVEVLLHNDTGCAVANACTALEAGATHVCVSVLGLGERVGITPLGGLLACLAAARPELVRERYRLRVLRELETVVAQAVGVEVPFCNPVTGGAAWRHTGAGHWAGLEGEGRGKGEVLREEDWGGAC